MSQWIACATKDVGY